MALTFNGTTDGIGTLDENVIKNTPAATIMAWCRPLSFDLNATPTVIGISIGPPPGLSGSSRLSIDRTPGGVFPSINITGRSLDSDGGSGVSMVTAPGFDYDLGLWQHVACVCFFSARYGIVYKNGQELFTGTFGSMTAGNTSNTNVKAVAIGANEDFAGGRWQGDIEDCRVYNRILSPNEIETIFNAMGADGIYSGLELWYPLNEFAPGTNFTQGVSVAQSTGARGILTTQAGNTAPVYSEGIIRGTRTKNIRSVGAG